MDYLMIGDRERLTDALALDWQRLETLDTASKLFTSLFRPRTMHKVIQAS